jgi:hypothetical protein
MIGEEEFSYSGKKVVEPGFTAVMTWQAIPPEENFPPLKEGDSLNIKEMKLSERQTAPPGTLQLSTFLGEDPDSPGSAFIYLSWIRIRIRNPDPDPGAWKLAKIYK